MRAIVCRVYAQSTSLIVEAGAACCAAVRKRNSLTVNTSENCPRNTHLA